ncbi:hypothetical protein IBB74_06735 [Listeria welshimeri]|uniref:hypothetical protein n=1 Tax=Listeria welshimeri TaxID=1643 RepID=UPI0016276D5A|nr:hypothetical protein [Listeria welshimeri]MBC1412446.1 hypothetical protein [Listeria welshimeri]MBC1468176.1 hypothetical protein [Listeria welshimeri]MBC1716650.1 hypothetical protein [Listeria welshimeri]MBC1717246.1 hypothetical protein [Listeria welshimeri]MBC1859782.1 hypothetical protein [Listeria welshimeri]
MNKQRYNDEWLQTYQQLCTVKQILDNTLTQAKTLSSNIDGMAWSGEHYEHIRALLNIVVAYHGDLLNSAMELNEVVDNFGQDYQAFEQMASYLAIRGIESD